MMISKQQVEEDIELFSQQISHSTASVYPCSVLDFLIAIVYW